MNINNNIASMNTLNQLSKTIFNASQSMEKISSSQRINKAADDAAGSAIISKMNALVGGYGKAIRNAEDGTSAIQISDGALNSMHNSLHRMRELALQSSNDTITDNERNMIQAEFAVVSNEIDRIADNTEFNTQKLLDGSFENKAIHIGANSDENITISIGEMSTSGLGLSAVDLSTQAGANASIGAIDNAINMVSEARGELGAFENRLGYSVNNLQVASVNTSAAESRIRDLFTSREIMEQIRNEVLMESTTAMLAHSNNNRQNALGLL